MKNVLAAFTAIGLAAALVYRERVDQRVLNMANGRGFIRDDERPEAEKPKKKKGKKS